ncbi:MAG: type II secretion system protein GspL, partial [Pseudomonas sp.]
MMMDSVFLPPAPGAELSAATRAYWLPAAAEGAWLTLAECAAAAQGRAVALVLPAELGSALAVSLPSQKPRVQRQALPYAVEELLAEDVEQLHLALGERLEDGRYRVIALRRALLAGWLRQLEELGLRVGALYLDADLLPRAGTPLLLLEERALLGG